MEELEEDEMVYNEGSTTTEKEDLEELDLEELLSELNEEEDEEDMEEEAEEADEDMESETEAESMDLEDMSEEDLKSFIEDVIADMVEAGELEAGEEMESEDMEDEDMEDMEDGGMETEEEEDVNIDELLAEIDSMDEMVEEGEELEEIFGIFKKSEKEGVESGTKTLRDFYEINKGEIDRVANLGSGGEKDKGELKIVNKWIAYGMPKMTTGAWRSDNSLLQKQMNLSSKEGNVGSAAGGMFEESKTTELDEAYSTIKTLRSELNEINLLNAKLLYTNKIFKGKNLTESQKVEVLENFDKTTTVKEVKLVYETLLGAIKTKKNRISENLGSASKSMGTTKKPIIEANDAFSRMREIAFYSTKH